MVVQDAFEIVLAEVLSQFLASLGGKTAVPTGPPSTASFTTSLLFIGPTESHKPGAHRQQHPLF